jgi:glucosamine kinase
VFFYGAGLSANGQKMRIKKMLQTRFENAALNVEHDLLGAARALSGNHPCIASIMGTGSNSCAYDGINIIANRPSMGFILGDQGSGAHIGKSLLSYIWNLEVDHPIRQNFEAEFSLDFDSCIKQLYSGPKPNRYLAQFAPFALKNTQDKEVRSLLNKSFSRFFESHVMAYPEHKDWEMNALGSVAKFFEIIWRPLAEERGIRVNKVLASPIDALTEYHLNS